MKYFKLLLLLSALGTSVAVAATGSIDTTHKTAKLCQDTACSSYGTVNFKPTLNADTAGAEAIVITDTEITGHAWGNSIGWINMAPTGAGVEVDAETGELSGLAYAAVGSWVNFKPTQVSGNPTVGVSINEDGQFEGYAYVSGLNGGWLKFDCGDSSSCVETDWRPIGSPDDEDEEDDDNNSSSGGGGSRTNRGEEENVSPTTPTLPLATAPNNTPAAVTPALLATAKAETEILTTIPPPPEAEEMGGSEGVVDKLEQALNNWPWTSTSTSKTIRDNPLFKWGIIIFSGVLMFILLRLALSILTAKIGRWN